MLLNIINNAIDAVEKKGIIVVSTGIKDENTLQVLVRDNGSGIPDDILKHIFEPFFTTKLRDEDLVWLLCWALCELTLED
jgi:two-component system NtrC family sensor kinase